MITRNDIQRLSQRIAREYKPIRIVLFGSHARGDAGADSDVDLLVILPFEGNGVRKAAEILNRVAPRFGVDLLARTPGDYQQRLKLNDFFLRHIEANGKVLYEAADA